MTSFVLTCYFLRVCRDVRPGVRPLWDARLRWGEGEGVGHVSGIQHNYLDGCSAAGNSHSGASDSDILSVFWGSVTFNCVDQIPCWPLEVTPLSICVCVFVVSPGAGWSGYSSGHQVCRQHPQGLCYIAIHHPVNSYIVLLAAGLRPHQVQSLYLIPASF